MPTSAKTKTAKQIGEEILAERAKPKKKKRVRRKDSASVKDSQTHIAAEARKGKRKPPPVPAKTLEQIAEMDPDDPGFKHPQGRPRKYDGKPKESLDWADSVRKAKQDRANQNRARIRKREAEIIKTEERRRIERGPMKVPQAKRKGGVGAEDLMYAEGTLNMDDWEVEELIRGYRKNRNGKWGKPPAFIPTEVQQECVRRLVKHGRKNLEGAFVKATELLVELAQTADSEKVKLEAIKEVMDRVAGKTPDHLKIAAEAPYEAFLADSLEPMTEVTETTSNRQTQTEWELEYDEDDLDSDQLGTGTKRLAAGKGRVIDAEVVE